MTLHKFLVISMCALLASCGGSSGKGNTAADPDQEIVTPSETDSGGESDTGTDDSGSSSASGSTGATDSDGETDGNTAGSTSGSTGEITATGGQSDTSGQSDGQSDDSGSAGTSGTGTATGSEETSGGSAGDGSGETSGNTDGDSIEPPAPVVNDYSSGLEQRNALEPFNLPFDGTTVGDYELVNAYPNLRFLEALLVADVPGEQRMVVVEQAGRIKVFDDSPDATSSKEILNFSDKVVFTGEQGLLGMTFDPNFESNRFVYVYYTTEDPDHSVISRMVWDENTDRLDTSNEETILTVDQPYHSHNAGMIEFGQDGYLYIALGDGGDGGDPHNYAQNLNVLLGSILRIDVHPADPNANYSIPDDNPYVGEENVREEIWAHGFRNPFRFSFDRETGDMWLGDVGQAKREEINVVRAGENYGWRVYEGTNPKESAGNTLPDSAFTPPVFEYEHDEGLAVIGGYVYRGTDVPSLVGRYLFTDHYGGTVWALDYDGEQVTKRTALATIDGPTSFGETRDGEVLVVSRYEGIFKFEQNISNVELPEKLSQTGLFEDLDSLTPISGFVEYKPAHEFWSDGLKKRRWIAVPDFKQISFTEDDWSFPLGSISIKHFELELVEGSPSSARRMETRVLHRTLQGWQGFTYRWNNRQNEATLVTERMSSTYSVELSDGTNRDQLYEYPSQTDCLICHNKRSTYLLGLETLQMNTDFTYDSGDHNQLDTLSKIEMFNNYSGKSTDYKSLPALDDQSASLQDRARAYLDVNCSVCHQPEGPAATRLDFRYSKGNNGMNAIGEPPQNGSLGLSDSKVIDKGNKENSILWLRMSTLGENRMPPLSSHVVDEKGVKLIGDWIDNL